MLLHFLATIVLGLGTAGLLMAINVATGKRLPTWLVPAGAGLAMLVFLVSMEYGWVTRTTAGLPEGVEVVSISRESMWYRPWTYLKPLSLRLVAIDTRRNRTHPEQPDQIMTTVMLLGRWMPIREIPVVFDCLGARRADLHAGVELEAGGHLRGADWRRLDPDEAALQTVCRERFD